MTVIEGRGNQATITPPNVPNEWEIGNLDIDAYLRRIDYGGSLTPSTEALYGLHRAHAEHIPFENLDIPLGRGISLALGDIQDKLLHQRRGGYCYEHNLLFAALLENLGFEVHRLVARVQPDKPGPQTHMTLNVSLDDQTWLADVGFGAALLEPIPLEDGIVVHQGAWTNGLARRDGTWRLRSQGPDGWTDLYSFTGEPRHLNDYIVYNHYTSTHPRSPFVGQVVAIQMSAEIRHTLRGRELTTTRADGGVERQEVPNQELPHVLEEVFDIHLNPDDVSRLTEGAG